MNIFDLPVLSALLAATSAGLTALGAVVTLPVAIVLVTIVVRALLIPVGVSTMRAELARRRLAPKLAELQKRWKRNPERLQRETLALYASEKVSPFAGIIPVLAQAPVLTLVYATFTVHELPGSLFGAALAAHFVAAPWMFLALLVLLATIAWFSRRSALRNAVTPPTGIARTLSWMPFATVVFGAFLPLAATLYLTVSAAWSFGERAVLRKVLAPA